jgi:hypothetical protein
MLSSSIASATSEAQEKTRNMGTKTPSSSEIFENLACILYPPQDIRLNLQFKLLQTSCHSVKTAILV